MAKKPSKSSKHEDMPDVETSDMDDDDETLVDKAKQARDAPGQDAPTSDQPSPESGAGEPGHPPTGSPTPPAKTTKVKIKGEGTIPIHTDGSMTRIERGKAVEVTDAQLAALKQAGIEFEKGEK